MAERSIGASPPDIKKRCAGFGLVGAGLGGTGEIVFAARNRAQVPGSWEFPIPLVSVRWAAIFLSSD